MIQREDLEGIEHTEIALVVSTHHHYSPRGEFSVVELTERPYGILPIGRVLIDLEPRHMETYRKFSSADENRGYLMDRLTVTIQDNVSSIALSLEKGLRYKKNYFQVGKSPAFYHSPMVSAIRLVCTRNDGVHNFYLDNGVMELIGITGSDLSREPEDRIVYKKAPQIAEKLAYIVFPKEKRRKKLG